MDIEQFRQAGYAAIDQICDYYSNLSKQTVKGQVEPGYLIEQLPTSAPAKGEAFNTIASDFQSLVMPGITHWQHGKFFAYFPAITTFESILGELYAASVSNPGFNWSCSPACTELEQVVLDWMVKILGLSDVFLTSSGKGGGIIGGSASESALTAAIAARERALRHIAHGLDGDAGDGLAADLDGAGAAIIDVPVAVRQEYTQRLVMYGSTQTHSLGAKAAVILGMQFRALSVSVNDGYALRGETLKKAIEQDIEAGLIPFLIIATVGTTSTGAVDRIAELGDVARGYPTMFMHVDAAWAGVAFALPEHRDELRLAEVNEYADSFCTNAHKWGLTGFDCSLFFVRNRRDLTDALDVTPAFLRTKEGDSGAVIDYRNWQLALGRRFRSVKLWFVLRGYGVEGFQSHLREGISHCRELAEMIKASANFELVSEPSLALLDFRLVLDGVGEESAGEAELNRLNVELNTRLSHRHDVILTQTVLKSVESEVFCIRFAMGGVNTAMDDVREVWSVVEAEAEGVLAERSTAQGKRSAA